MSKIANISTENMQDEATYTDKTKSLLSYARVPEEDYGLRSVNVGISDIVEDVKFSHFSAANSKTMYTQYNRVDKMMIKIRACSLFLGSFAKTHLRQRLSALHLLMIFASTNLLRKICFAWFWPRTRLSKMTTNVSFFSRILFIHALEPPWMNCSLATFSETKRRGLPSRCFLIPNFSKRSISSTSVYQSARPFCVLSTTTQGKCKEEKGNG